MTTKSTSTIAKLNDAFRSFPSSGWVFTSAVYAMGTQFIEEAMTAIRTFDAFTEDNDPYGEHDFGAVTVRAERLFWKIDYYDQALEFGSSNPVDLTCTRRIMTIMLAAEN